MNDRCGGFTLLEVLVAFVILALSVSMLMQVFSVGLRSAALSEEYTRATLLAESKLAAVGPEIPVEEGVTEGEYDDKYRWRVTIGPYEWSADDDFTDLPATPLQVTVEVLWGEGERERSVPLTSLRLAATL